MVHATPHFRSFLAIAIPSEVQAHLAAWQEKAMRGGDGVIRRVPEGNFHITLFFFGEQTNGWLDQVAEIMHRPLRGEQPFTLALSNPGLLHPQEEPRNVLVMYPEPLGPIRSLRKTLGRAPRDVCPSFQPEASFTPHCTLGRTRHPFSWTSFDRPLLSFQVETVTLFFTQHSIHSVQYFPWKTLPLG